MASAISKQRGESKSNNLNYDGNLNDSNLENRILEYDFNCNYSNIKNLVYNNALNLMSSKKKKLSATSWTAPAASRFIRTNIRPTISIQQLGSLSISWMADNLLPTVWDLQPQQQPLRNFGETAPIVPHHAHHDHRKQRNFGLLPHNQTRILHFINAVAASPPPSHSN